MMSKKSSRVFWIGDAVAHTGFARVTHNILKHLMDEWQVTVLGINHVGDPHPYPYDIYPAEVVPGDVYGLERAGILEGGLKPAVTVILNDPWVVVKYLDKLKGPVIAYMPVDSPNIMPKVAEKLNKLALAVFYTEFGLDEARRAGFTGEAIVVPHGVDTSIYSPVNKLEARAKMGLPPGMREEAFIVGCVNRNQPRKRLDLTIAYFAKWVKECQLPSNVYLHLHCAIKDIGWDVVQLAQYYGINDRLIITHPKLTDRQGINEEHLKYIYSSFDVQVSTSMGEGWGLTTAEGMACGVPQIVPEWAALAEWPRGAVRYVPCTTFEATPQVNTIGGIADETEYIRALHELYTSERRRKELSAKGLELIGQQKFRWHNIASQFSTAIRKVSEVAAVV